MPTKIAPVTKSKRKATAAIANITEMLKLFKGGKYWTQGSMYRESYYSNKDGSPIYEYCLVGANQEADGIGEEVALNQIAAVICDTPDTVDRIDPEDTCIEFNDGFAEDYDDIKKVLLKARKILRKVVNA